METDSINLKWQSYNTHLQKLMENLLSSGESSDVTLVCNDQVKFKAHKFLLKASSPVFENIFDEIVDDATAAKSIVYMRGVSHENMRNILEYLYNGITEIDQEKLPQLLKVAEDLQIKEIGYFPTEDDKIEALLAETSDEDLFISDGSLKESKDHGTEEPFQVKWVINHVYEDPDIEAVEEIQNESFDDIDIIKKEEVNATDEASESYDNENQMLRRTSTLKLKSQTAHPSLEKMIYEGVTKLKNMKPSVVNYTKLRKSCKYKSTNLESLEKHVERVHECLVCSECDVSFTDERTLRQHILLVHESFNCSKCNFQSTVKSKLEDHYKSEHRFKCESCDFQTSSENKLRTHKYKYHQKQYCSICNYQAKDTKDLTEHVKSKHLSVLQLLSKEPKTVRKVLSKY